MPEIAFIALFLCKYLKRALLSCFGASFLDSLKIERKYY